MQVRSHKSYLFRCGCMPRVRSYTRCAAELRCLYLRAQQHKVTPGKPFIILHTPLRQLQFRHCRFTDDAAERNGRRNGVRDYERFFPECQSI